ncbi:2-amino-4-hydroxy-6-hydroxymethyldihydropteridine diphosphokinase [Candidatus Woesearchaeota archaeon]|nr:2-amino-4-hydroxy-6-hydroxymethyldihydropteridine diphosphokinase [Candidatus Woesearchaeota archaeon]
MVKVYLSIGSNLGNERRNLEQAIAFLKEKCKIIKVSPFYKTKPMYSKNQPAFLNAAIGVETALSPKELLFFLKSIEKRMGRKKAKRYGPRLIDIDILLYGKQIIKNRGLIIPHPRMQERQFVLQPLAEIAPKVVHPLLKKRITTLLRQQIIRN